MNSFPAFFFTAEFGCCFGVVTCLHLSCLVGAHMQKSLTLLAVKLFSGTLFVKNHSLDFFFHYERFFYYLFILNNII